jgi:hypothetical protein
MTDIGGNDGDDDDDEVTTSIQCDAPGCGKWYDAMDLDPPLALDVNEIASQYDVWHCDECKKLFDYYEIL